MLIEANAKGETHYDHMKRVRKDTLCTVWELTFGGRCLGCGWVFDYVEEVPRPTQEVKK